MLCRPPSEGHWSRHVSSPLAIDTFSVSIDFLDIIFRYFDFHITPLSLIFSRFRRHYFLSLRCRHWLSPPYHIYVFRAIFSRCWVWPCHVDWFHTFTISFRPPCRFAFQLSRPFFAAISRRRIAIFAAFTPLPAWLFAFAATTPALSPFDITLLSSIIHHCFFMPLFSIFSLTLFRRRFHFAFLFSSTFSFQRCRHFHFSFLSFSHYCRHYLIFQFLWYAFIDFHFRFHLIIFSSFIS